MSNRRVNSARIVLNVRRSDADYITHAAKLTGLTRREYIVRAINDRLRREGVDAVLLRQSDWAAPRSEKG